ncbi:PfkB family carbohydrate kinase, partial [Streptomyces mirabilis]
RNGLNFVERGYGIRGALGVSDRAHTAVSQLRKGDIDWDTVFAAGVRWFHTGGIFAGLSDTTVDVADEAMAAARRHGLTVSYDPNYRPSLWAGRGGPERARETDLRLARHADVVVGALGMAGRHPGADRISTDEVPDALASVAGLLPDAQVLATTLREVPSAGVNDWSSAAWSAETGCVIGPRMPGLHVLDRIGSGDGFAAGLIHGLLAGTDLERALAYGTALGALTMTTPGDVAMASLAEVEALIAGASAAVRR